MCNALYAKVASLKCTRRSTMTSHIRDDNTRRASYRRLCQTVRVFGYFNLAISVLNESLLLSLLSFILIHNVLNNFYFRSACFNFYFV